MAVCSPVVELLLAVILNSFEVDTCKFHRCFSFALPFKTRNVYKWAYDKHL